MQNESQPNLVIELLNICKSLGNSGALVPGFGLTYNFIILLPYCIQKRAHLLYIIRKLRSTANVLPSSLLPCPHTVIYSSQTNIIYNRRLFALFPNTICVQVCLNARQTNKFEKITSKTTACPAFLLCQAVNMTIDNSAAVFKIKIHSLHIRVV